jgi:hypothetical protein
MSPTAPTPATGPPDPMIDRGCLLCSVKGGLGLELPVDLASDVADQAAPDLPVGLALGAAAGDIGAGSRVMAPASEHDGVQRAVELPVAGPVDSLGRLGCQAGVWLLLTRLGGACRLTAGKVASCPASRCDLTCALSAM